MYKLSIGRYAVISLLLFPFSNNAQAEYFFVYGPPAPVVNVCGGGCRPACHRVRRCPVRRVHRPCAYRPPCRPRPACHVGRPRCCARPARPCCYGPPPCSSVSVQYFCPPPRPLCGYGVPLDDNYAGWSCGGSGCGGGCGGGYYSDCSSSAPEPAVFFGQPEDFGAADQMPCYSCNQDLATGDDDPCANPDMQINW